VKWKIPFIDEHIIREENALSTPILAITESWLKPYMTDAQISLTGYKCLRADRPNRKGGGCLLYVTESLLVTDNFSYSDKYCNLLYCCIDSMDAIIAVIYRPPDAPIESFKETLNHLQTKLGKRQKAEKMPGIFLMGDFNLPEIDWEFPDHTQCHSKNDQLAAKELLDFADRNFLSQAVNKPTRGVNIIDLVFTNRSQDIVETNTTDTQISDHNLVQLTLGYNPMQPERRTPKVFDKHSFRAVDFHRADFDKMNSQFSAVDWPLLEELCDKEGDGSDFLELITLTVLQVTLINSPKKPVDDPGGRKRAKTRQSRDRYILKRRRRKINARIHALKEKSPTSNKIAILTKEANILTFEIRELIVHHLNEMEAKAVSTIKTNPRYFYSFAKRHAKTKSSVAPIRDSHGVLKTEPAEKAELLQSQYMKVFSNPELANIESCTDGLNPSPSGKLDHISFDTDDIIEAIKELDAHSATPEGDIPAKILVKCKEALALPLFKLWDKSFRTGVIPQKLKTQYITPVFKKGDRTDAANYRPVSITSHLIKIFERVLRKHIVAHMESNNFLSPNQHGFRKKRSCLTQLLSHVDNVLKTLNEGEEVDVIYLDYAKAFDKVDHKILLAKAKRYGISGQTLQWLTEFLGNRLQTVLVEGAKSTFSVVLSGVPQGTVLGPILFILYIDDQLEILVTALGKVFADDTKLVGKIIDMAAKSLLQEDLFNVISWAINNNMQLNEKKFEVLNYKLNHSQLLREMPFSSENYEYSLTTGDAIEPVKTVRDLGVLLSNDCSWTPHIHKMLEGARTMAAWVLSVFSNRSPFLMLTLFKTMVRSKLEYCCPVWNPHKISDIKAIENIQRNYTRRINGCQDIDYWARLKKLGIMSLQRRRERYVIIHTWKILNGRAPNDIDMLFKDTLRHGKRAIVPPTNNSAQRSIASHYENSFGVCAAKLWNLLPASVNNHTALEPFKIALGKFLESFPDTPPLDGYSPATNNSLLEWNLQKYRHQV